MKFFFEKALSLLDASTSFVYYLLGRDLDSHDIQIIDYLFTLDLNTNFNTSYAVDCINNLNKGN